MSTTYSADCYNYVLPDLPMAPPTLVLNAIRDSVIELCERALIYRQELQEILVLGPTSTTLAADAAIAATSITVADITGFADDDTITVELDDGTLWRGHVSGTPSGVTINLDGALNDEANSGATVTKLVYLYPITVPTGTAFVKVLKAWLNDSPLDPISEDDLDNEFNNTDFAWVGTNWRTDVNVPTRFYMADDTTIGLTMPPSTCGEGNLRILAALKPTRASTTFPTIIYERYVETIAHGAKYRIMQIPKKPYTDLKMAAYHYQMFNSLVGEAMIRAAKSATRAPLRSHTIYNLR
jgi:hypothetical protein